MLTSENKVTKCRNQNMAFLLKVNILTLPSIICVGKRSDGFKILSLDFSKMLSIPRCFDEISTIT